MNIADWLYQLTPSPSLLLLIVALIALLECLAVVGLILPGVVLMTAAASLAGHQELSAAWVIAAAFFGALAGDGLSFALGHTQRERIPRLWPFYRHPEWLARGARFFQRYGTLSVIFARFVGPVRPIMPLIAGMLHMSPLAFFWASLLSALLWAPAYVLPGYLLGRTWQQLLNIPPGTQQWLIALGGTIALLALTFSWLRQQLARGGRVYAFMARLARGKPWRRRLWMRLRSRRPRGEFPLASLLLLFVSLIALCLWTLLVLEHQGPLPMDLQIQALVDAIERPWLSGASEFMARLGDTYGALALVLPWGLWLLWARHLAAFIHLAAGLGGIAVANTLFKHLAGRERPGTPDYLMGSMAYPSAHTSTAVVLYGLAAAFIAQELPPRWRFWIYWLAILFAVPMALSRLTLGVHWASDLIGGALLGLVACALVRVSYHRFAHRALLPTPWPWLISASLVLVAARMLWLPPI
ncbi:MULTISPECIES: bifunctional DedA family/phosphatase PAP2 family protein [Halomonadaceae]|uniref:bifunctional DedA family/phosphatase PAP2 family protein n=1 Tax=Halomonadaceae TaxID=28256 RepID=UPI001597C81C|nr:MULTISPECIES: bifunctional DedA family/phosphatase PAP2 family protein [Halomonas]QJQ94093.1 bifunctional DedA family/phosphatase PAP2 family protein [Halomonas sp. PA5]